MGGFVNYGQVVDACVEGRTLQRQFRKVPAVVTAQATWYDYSMAPGTPAPQYYAAAPLTSKAMSRSADGGLNHGPAIPGYQKFLKDILLVNVTAGGAVQRLMIVDYLMYYPFIDMGTADEQTMTQDDVLPRFTDGEGVMMMAVLVAPHGLAGDTFFVTYTNQDGVAGRVTPLQTMSTAVSVNGTLLTSGTGGNRSAFLPLQGADSGVRSVEAVQCTAGTDVGLFTIVLVKPVVSLSMREITAPTEVDFLIDQGLQLPAVGDDAYLNFLSCPMGSLSAAALFGLTTFVWN